MFQIELVDNIKIHILCSANFFSPKILLFVRYMEKYGGAREATDEIIWHMRFVCLDK